MDPILGTKVVPDIGKNEGMKFSFTGRTVREKETIMRVHYNLNNETRNETGKENKLFQFLEQNNQVEIKGSRTLSQIVYR